jgi:hypothetical protein
MTPRTSARIGRLALRREPEFDEGAVAIKVDADLADLPVRQPEQERRPTVHINSAHATTALVRECHHRVLALEELLDLDLKRLPHFVDLASLASYLLVALIHGRVKGQLGEVEPRAWLDVLAQDCLNVALSPSL